MSKQPRVAINPDTLKPIIEAMIFASEEPLSARALLRLLSGDGENGRADEATPAGTDEPESGTPENTEPEAAGSEVVELEPAAAEPASDEPVPVTAETDLPETEDQEADRPEPEAETESDAPADEPMSIEMIGDAVEHSETEPVQDAGMPDPTVIIGGTIEIAGEHGGEVSQETGNGNEDVNELANAMNRASRRRGDEDAPVLDQAYLRMLVDELNEEYETSGRVFRIVEFAGGFQFATIREFGEFVAMLSKDKARRRLSPAALETLAIIAYRQPVSKPEVEAIRGVNCDQVLLSLMEKNLVAITGRSEAVGRPLLYGSTEDFLRIFGLKGLGDLPKLREIEELMEEDAFSAEKADVITVDQDTDVEEIEAKVGAAGHHGEHSEDGLPPDSRADQNPEPPVPDEASTSPEENEGDEAEGNDDTDGESEDGMEDEGNDEEGLEDEGDDAEEIEEDSDGDSDEDQDEEIDDEDSDEGLEEEGDEDLEDDSDEDQDEEIDDEDSDEGSEDEGDEAEDLDEEEAGDNEPAADKAREDMEGDEKDGEDSEMAHDTRVA